MALSFKQELVLAFLAWLFIGFLVAVTAYTVLYVVVALR